MSVRNAEVKAYVRPELKAQATELYAHWGLSLSDAVNAFLVKSVDVGGFPFALKSEREVAYDPGNVLPVDERWGSSVLPKDMDDDEDGLYEQLVS